MTLARSAKSLASYVIGPSELHAALNHGTNNLSSTARTIAICGSWFLPNDAQRRTGFQVFKNAHVPGARYFDLDRIADTSSPYPHMLPSAETFRDAMRSLGINRDDTLVVYDTQELGTFSAPRVAWTLKVFGHQGVHLLDNFKTYIAQGFPTEHGEPPTVEPTEYPLPVLDRSRVVTFDEIKTLVSEDIVKGHSNVQILDARPNGRWTGAQPEPRPGLPSGHIPGSISIPVTDLLDANTKTLRSPTELRDIFERKGIDPDRPIISTCGTGVTATIIDTALRVAGLGEGDRRIYDGSWTEWAQRVSAEDGLIITEEKH